MHRVYALESFSDPVLPDARIPYRKKKLCLGTLQRILDPSEWWQVSLCRMHAENEEKTLSLSLHYQLPA